MSVDYDYKETELEAFSSRINKELYSIQNRLDDVEAIVCNTHDETIDSMDSIKSLLNQPFTKLEGLILFFGGIGGNFFVSGITEQNRGFSLYTGIGILSIVILTWSLLFFYKKSKK